jgi:hypothetical protein
MNADQLDPIAQRVLRALYELAQLDCPAHAGVLAKAVGLRAADVARVLLVLDARGLAVAERGRLTMAGLARAARVPALHLSRASWFAAARAVARQHESSLRRVRSRRVASGEPS